MPSTAPSDSPETYTVTAVRYGTLETHRSDVFLNYADYRHADGPAAMDYYFWVIRNQDRTILLDTGFDAVVGTRRGRTTLIDPRRALDILGVLDEPDTTVVLSHAHYDHIGNAGYFRRARMLMAEAEYDFWVSHPRRLSLTDNLTEPGELEVLRRAFSDGRLHLLSGRVEIAPGVEIIPGAGHTPGQLMIVVSTEADEILLTSDAVHVDEELDRRMPFRHMCDLKDTADTYDAIYELQRAGRVTRIFAGHQPDLVGRFAIDPRLPGHTAILTSPTPPPIEGHHHVSH